MKVERKEEKTEQKKPLKIIGIGEFQRVKGGKLLNDILDGYEKLYLNTREGVFEITRLES